MHKIKLSWNCITPLTYLEPPNHWPKYIPIFAKTSWCHPSLRSVTQHQSKIIYRPVIVFPNVSKICERIMLKQILQQINKYLLQNLCGYRKCISTQTALTMLPEKWKKALDDIGYAVAILMDLSNAFDTINHELLIEE